MSDEKPRDDAGDDRARTQRPRRDGDSPSRSKGARSGGTPRQRRDGDRKPYGKDGDRKPSSKDGDRKPYRGDRDSAPRGADRGGKPPYRKDGDRKPYGKDGDRKPYRKDADRKPSYRRDDRAPSAGDRAGGERRPTRPPQDQRVSGPHLPDDVTPRDLNGSARGELKTLSKENAETVARHLVMASRLIDDDPALAHEHALAASRSAGRVAVVRETVAITAYATGDFALALRELRTYRRISGKDDQIPLMVDSERGVGKPERAIEAGRAVDREALDTPTRVELAIAMSGARLDLEQPERALLELDIPELNPDVAYSWSADLFAARATVLEELGRESEAETWRRRAEMAEHAWLSTHADDVVMIDELEEIDSPSADAEPESGAGEQEDA